MKRTFAFILFSFVIITAFAQSPESFTYQSVVRDAVGNILPNQAVTFQFSILNSGSTEYTEVHYTNTNNFGLVNIVVGQGSVLSGDFTLLDWQNNQYDLKIELDENGGSSFTEMGIVPFHSVPYALHAKTAEFVDDADADPLNEIQDIALTGNYLSISDGSTVDLSSLNSDNQTLSYSGNNLSISNGNTITLTDNVDDADNDPTNEIELPATAVVGQVITWDGSAWVAQNSGTGSDNWGTQVVETEPTVIGDGTMTNPIGLAQQGALSGQILKWNGSAWLPADDENTTYSANNGIDISGNVITNTAPDQIVGINGSGATSVTGTYPNFTISSTDNVDDADNDPTNEIELPATAVVGQVITWDGTAWVAQNSGTGSDNWGTQVAQTNSTIIGDGTTGNPLAIAQQGASTGQVLKWNGSAWVPATDDNTNYSAGYGIDMSGDVITNTAPDQTVSIIGDGGTTVGGIYPNFIIASTDNVDDADNDPNNELQDIYLMGTNLSITGGSTVDLSSLSGSSQTLSVSGNNLTISDGNTVTLTDNVDDADNDPTNEIELPASATTGQVLTWDGSDWVAQNSDSGADNWGSQVAVTSGSLVGDGTASNPLDIGDLGAINGQILMYNGSEWVPGTDENTTYQGGFGIDITGDVITNTSQDQVVTITGSGATSVSGTYPNFTISSLDNVDDADSDPTNEIELPVNASSGDMAFFNGTDWTKVEAPLVDNMVLTYCGGVPTWTANGQCPPVLGDIHEGGVVFYIFEIGDPGYVEGETHGLVCALEDQNGGNEIRWYNGIYTTTGATATSIGSGQTNTSLIISSQGSGSYAATVCDNYTSGGYSDWFLPSQDELNKMFQNKTIIDATATANGGSNFENDNYWSSTEISFTDAWRQFFGDGFQWGEPKWMDYYVRAVRSF